MIIYTVMIMQISGELTYHWVDRSFKTHDAAKDYIEKENSRLTRAMLETYQCDDMNYYLQFTVLEDE